MNKGIAIAGLTVCLVAGSAVGGYGQDIQAIEQAYYNQLRTLRANIAIGWTPVQVVAVMGEPQRLETYVEGADLVEVWGYRGYEVFIEFRNGLLSYWFIRFMP